MDGQVSDVSSVNLNFRFTRFIRQETILTRGSPIKEVAMMYSTGSTV